MFIRTIVLVICQCASWAGRVYGGPSWYEICHGLGLEIRNEIASDRAMPTRSGFNFTVLGYFITK